MTEALVQELTSRAAAPAAAGPDWLERERQAAIEEFARSGFPSARHEEWRFTPLAPIVQGTWRPAPSDSRVRRADLRPFLFGHPEWPRLVFVNGLFSQHLSTAEALPEGVEAGSLADAIRQDGRLVQRHLGRHAPMQGSPFTALNTAFVRDGAVVRVAAGADLPAPVHLLFIASSQATDTVAHPRNMIVVERGARAAIIESYVSLAPGLTYWTNAVTEVAVEAGAWMEHTRIQRESERGYHVALTHVDQARDSHYRSFTLAMGGAMARHNLHARLGDENVETLLYGLYLTRGDQVVDNHTAIYHDHPNCRSWEVYKGILEGQSRAVFNGKVLVRPEAQKTDAKQTNRNLLLSDGTRVDTKPQLEIFADDVKCTHGATVGRLDDIARFYARSRGLPAAEAERLLTYAFAAEVVDEVALMSVRDELDRLVLERLGGA